MGANYPPVKFPPRSTPLEDLHSSRGLTGAAGAANVRPSPATATTGGDSTCWRGRPGRPLLTPRRSRLATWSARSGIVTAMPRHLYQARIALDEYALSPRIGRGGCVAARARRGERERPPARASWLHKRSLVYGAGGCRSSRPRAERAQPSRTAAVRRARATRTRPVATPAPTSASAAIRMNTMRYPAAPGLASRIAP